MTAVAERYTRSLQSSHLEWRIEPGAIDMLTASGLLRDSLGVSLLRLRAEFDGISGDPGARRLMPHLKSAKSVQVMMLAMLKSMFRETSDDEAFKVVGKLLDQWCDPNCEPCTGRGQIGAYGEPQMICKACGGSKHRNVWWESREQEVVGHYVEREMVTRVDSAVTRIRKLLRQD